MQHLNISNALDRSPRETVERLESLLAGRVADGRVRVKLRAPLEVPGLDVAMTLARDVDATIYPIGVDGRAYRITWKPAVRGPFPTFSGAMFVDDVEADPQRSLLTLDGRYDPPFNVVGDVFDAVVGRKIALASATEFLDRLASGEIEADGRP